jgi:hypothetical protein
VLVSLLASGAIESPARAFGYTLTARTIRDGRRNPVVRLTGVTRTKKNARGILGRFLFGSAIGC